MPNEQGAQPTGQPQDQKPQDQKPADAGAGTPLAQAPTLENLTASQIKELYTKSPELFAEVLPPKPEEKKVQDPPKDSQQGAASQGAADDLKVEVPKEAQIDPEVLKEFTALAKENGLNSKQASAAVAFYFKLNERAHAANRAAFDGWRKANEAALKADPEFGADFEASKVVAQAPLAKYGSPELAKALAESGWENHPLFAKFLHKLGKAMAEDSTRPPRPVSRDLSPEEKQLQALYPTMAPRAAPEN